MTNRPIFRFWLAAALVLSLGACSAGDTESEGAEEAAPEAAPAVAASAELPDTLAAAVWAYIHEQGYTEWAEWPEKGQLYPGGEPHGALLTTFLNGTAEEALAAQGGSFNAGSIVIKQNFMPDSTLAAITVMYKVTGYNAEHNDWWFAKYLADGTLDTMPNGMDMEGRLPGCQNCHGGAAANDYIFTGSLGG
jgi:hypothetical protein